VTLGDGIGGLSGRGLKRVGDEAPLTNSSLTISTGQGLGNNQTSNNGSVTKRPRVRDYVGSRGGNRHMIADLGQRLSPSLSSLATSSGGFSSPFAAALHQQQLLAAAAAAAAAAQAAATGSTSRHSSFPLVNPPSTRERDVTLASNSCDKTKDHFLRHSLPSSMVEVTEDSGAPLDLCIKKPRDRDEQHKAPSPSRTTASSSSLLQSSFPMSAVQHLEDVSRRLSESSEGSSSSIFPKKRGRKPKSLLANATLPSATVTSSTGSMTSLPVTPLALLQQQHQQLHQQQLQANEQKPRKRGRPPLMSPPPNIDVSAASSSSSKFLNPQDILQATILAQQQLAAAQAARWSPLFPTGQLMMPNGMREALAHLYTNSLQQAAAAGASTSNSASRGLPTTSSSSGFDSLSQKPSDSSKVEVNSVDSDSDDEDSSKPDDFKPGTSAEDIRIPLKFGWRRYTIINRISSSGVKGDVVYISPEGKKLRTLNDIQKYLNKGLCPTIAGSQKKLSRDNFSFSTKWVIGEFNQPSDDKSGHQLLGESEILKRVDELQRLKRKKLINKKSPLSSLPSSSGVKKQKKTLQSPIASSTSRPSPTHDQQMKIKEDIIRSQAAAHMLQMASMVGASNFRIDEMKILEVIQALQQHQQQQQSQTPQHKKGSQQQQQLQQRLEAERLLAEELKKQKIMEEELKKQQENQAVAAKAREVEMKRQQEEQLQKVQEMYKKRELQMLAEIEKERKRQHMLLVRQMDFHKKLEERERKKEELLQEKRIQQEKKVQKKKLEVELLKHLKKPVDDMRLKDHKSLPVLNRIPGLKLPAKAFADILMVYEFLNNFGETLGFDMDSLPTLNSMQLALLNMDETSEEELLSVLKHLIVCAIEDPGLPVNVTTVMGQKLKDAPINSNNMSEILRLYLQSFILHRKSALEGQEGRIFKALAANKPFLSLPPTLKAEILAYLCNELLCNQSIVKQLDENIESVTSLRKDKWIVDCDLRKFKSIKAKREKKAEEELAEKRKKEQEEQNKEAHSETNAEKDKETTEDPRVDDEEAKIPLDKKVTNATANSNAIDDDSGDSEDDGAVAPGDQDEEPEMTNEEVDKKIEKLSRQCTLLTNKLNKAVHGLRVSSLGQDRHRRRYWVLPASGGIFVEGMESGEPEELENNIPYEDDLANDERNGNDADGSDVLEEEEEKEKNGCVDEDVREKMDDEPIKEENRQENGLQGKSKEEEGKEMSNEDNKDEEIKKSKESDSQKDETLSPVKEEAVSKSDSLGISPLVASAIFKKEENKNDEQNSSSSSTPLSYLVKTEKAIPSKPWFSLLPREPCNEVILDIASKPESSIKLVNGEVDGDSRKTPSPPGEFNSQSSILPVSTDSIQVKNIGDLLSHLSNGGSIDASILSSLEVLGDVCPSLQKRLQQQKEEQHDGALKIPPEYQYGWWRLTDQSQVRSLLESLHERGVRERLLHKHTQKYFSYIVAKLKCNAAEFDVTELDRKIYEECSFGAPRDSLRYSRDVAMRLDIAVIEEIELLEEKISNSSMQVRGWKPTVKVANDPDLSLKRKLIRLPKDLFFGKGNGTSKIADDEEEMEEDDDEEEANASDEENCSEDEEDEDAVDTLAFAKERLLRTEAMIERRYLKPPLGFKSNTIIVSTGSSDELAENAADENAPSGLLRWRDAVRESTTCFQLALLVNFLESCIAWDKSIMRASCQFCSSGENEAELLLCDGCDKGYHMYCFKPKMEKVPEGDWFCFECMNKNTIDKVCIVCGKKGKLLSCDTCPKVFHPNCIDPPVSKPPKGKWSCHICVRKPKKTPKTVSRRSAPSVPATEEVKTLKETPSKEATTPYNCNAKESGKKSSSKGKKKEKEQQQTVTVDESNRRETRSSSDDHQKEQPESTPKSTGKKEKKSKGREDNKNDLKDLFMCSTILSQMVEHDDAWPFKTPVNTKQFPTYRKIIKNPMDMQTMRTKLETGAYKSRADFYADVELIFDNCETFNEDESPVGRAGHSLRAFFDKRWKELCEK